LPFLLWEVYRSNVQGFLKCRWILLSMISACAWQVREAAAAAGVLLGGENALPCFLPGLVDAVALERIVYNTQSWSPPLQENALKEAMYRGASAGSLTGSGSSSDTLTAAASAPELQSKAAGQPAGR
jgi:hypothetical protein